MAVRTFLLPLFAACLLCALSTDAPAQTTDSAVSLDAHAKYDAGRLDEAETVFRHLLQDFPSSALASDAQYYLGWIAYKKNTGEAEARWQAVVDTYPDSTEAPKALMSIASVHYKAHAPKPTRIADMEGVVARYPQSPEQQEARLRLLVLNRIDPPDFRQALSIADYLIGNAVDEKWRAEAYVEKGLTYMQRYGNGGRKNADDCAQALNVFASVRTRYPAQGDAVARGELHLAKHYLYVERNSDKARQAMQSTLQAYPQTSSTAELLYQIAYASYVDKNYDRCIELCEGILLDQPPSDWNSYLQYLIGDCHLQADRKPEAKAAFQKTIGLYPGTNWAKVAEGVLANLKLD